MLKFYGNLILENEEDFKQAEFYPNHCYIEGAVMQQKDYPSTYPATYHLCRDWGEVNGEWYPYPLNKIIESQESHVISEQTLLKKLKNFQKPLDK